MTEWKSIVEPPKPTEIEIINVSFKNLNELPDWIYKCKYLKKLYCHDNKITQLPDNLPNSLQYLYCHRNELIKLPDKLPDSLLELHCYNNKLLMCNYDKKITLLDNLFYPNCCNRPVLLQKLYCYNNRDNFLERWKIEHAEFVKRRHGFYKRHHFL